MRKSKQFISMPVISLQEGQQIGTIKGLVVDPIAKRVAALIIEQKGWFQEQKFIPYNHVRSVGEDAVTVNQGTAVQKGGSLPEIINLVKNNIKITGTRVVTESGTILGEVDDYYVNLDSGELVGIEFSGGYISGIVSGRAFLDVDHVLTVGKEMIVCSDQALEKTIKLEGGLQEKLRGIKDTTGNLWETTVQKTRGLSSSVNQSIGKLKRNKTEDKPDSTPVGAKPNQEQPAHTDNPPGKE
ncbi:PRC-barrel domain-containing protein [Desulfoscipio geothermicus]|uniref:Uncharacterized protein YrrD, contains PRC-barrel domain n=1 Tax=Desulfoscipio geothermicus DSM 3669 TaxID=1121426 RepID=A0A1I6DGA5_9FIRM|nr:PRC-barrel domain-containing protein [Desulfoscipio geothermicus]SFR04408.1 Uncharacterized protein YrrD, contains PRC-barrel domain [Desulfoscipio geothermicus DSM 3669]